MTDTPDIEALVADADMIKWLRSSAYFVRSGYPVTDLGREKFAIGLLEVANELEAQQAVVEAAVVWRKRVTKASYIDLCKATDAYRGLDAPKEGDGE